jgi:hypothetical protein
MAGLTKTPRQNAKPSQPVTGGAAAWTRVNEMGGQDWGFPDRASESPKPPPPDASEVTGGRGSTDNLFKK